MFTLVVIILYAPLPSSLAQFEMNQNRASTVLQLKTNGFMNNHLTTSSVDTNKVILQPYYWLYPDTGTYYNMITDFMSDFNDVGFDALWLPPPTKTLAGDIATGGYEPYDYYDLGEYDQGGRIRTRWGTRAELENLISIANTLGIDVIADVIANHRVGGDPEFNPNVGYTTPTNFMNIDSGLLKMNYTHFWPNEYGIGDTLQYGDFPDISHANPEVQNEFYKWGRWLRDEIGFDAFRFDTANGIDPAFVKNWMLNVSDTWGISEYWMRYPDRDEMLTYLDNTQNTVSTFDHPLMIELRDMSNFGGSYDMRLLENAGIAALRKDQSITFAVNHDTYRDAFNIEKNRHMAYAYILTHEGYPSVFWMDYLDLNLHNHLRSLVQIHNQYANGPLTILYTDDDLYVAQRGGEPGLLVALNDNPIETKSITVNSKWKNTVLYDLTGQMANTTVDDGGEVTISVPPSGYSIFSSDLPIASLFDVPEIKNYVSPTIIEKNQIEIDGDFEDNWGMPIYMDVIGDSNQYPSDLSNVYIKHDNENLYIGFGYSNLYLADDHREIDFGIALDIKEGGSNDDPGIHPKIRWGGSANSNKPELVYYIHTSQPQEDYKRSISSAIKYTYNDNLWDEGAQTEIANVASSPMLGFIETKIPLQELDLGEGGNIGVKIFSSLTGSEGVRDSVPQDDTISFDNSDSWLFMPETLELVVDSRVNTTSSISPDPSTSKEDDSSFDLFTFEFISGAFMMIIFIKKRRNPATIN